MVTNQVLFHDKDRRLLQDVVTCIREHHDRRCRLQARPPRRPLPEGFGRDASHATGRRSRRRWRSPPLQLLAVRLSYQYPREVIADGERRRRRVERLTWEGAASAFRTG
ncbi:hypothetical protein ACRAWD_11360 [Caulobacter segnis]